jgi:RNase H-like domain found in reverse transcriptase
MQLRKEGKLHPFAFYSRKMSPAELNYDIYDKEFLAIVAAFQEWRVYLKGFKHQVKMLTDYKNLTYFTTIKALNRR